MKFSGATSVSKASCNNKLSKHFSRNNEIYYTMSMTFFDNESLDLMIRLTGSGSEEGRRELEREGDLETWRLEEGTKVMSWLFSVLSATDAAQETISPLCPP